MEAWVTETRPEAIYMILIKNLAALGLCPENLCEVEFKGSDLICLGGENF